MANQQYKPSESPKIACLVDALNNSPFPKEFWSIKSCDDKDFGYGNDLTVETNEIKFRIFFDSNEFDENGLDRYDVFIYAPLNEPVSDNPQPMDDKFKIKRNEDDWHWSYWYKFYGHPIEYLNKIINSLEKL